MDSFKSALPRHTRLASIPLLAAYGARPLSTAIVRALGCEFNTLAIMLPWLLLALIGCLVAMKGPGPRVDWKKLGFQTTLFLLLLVVLVLYISDIRSGIGPLIPYLREMTPAVYLLFSLLWAFTCGVPNRADFQRFGAMLAMLCIIDLGVEAIAYGVVPTVRWIGNADILAGLLLVSLCASLKPGDNEGGRYEPDQGHPIWRGLVMVGILACLSRTGLFAAAWVVLCFGRGKFVWRIGYSLLCWVLLGLTFFLPPTPSDAVRYIDYWLWVEALRLYTQDPSLLLTGFSLSSSLPVTFPAGMAGIWRAATGQSAMLGVFLHQVPSFWLRLGMGWGFLAPTTLLLTLFAMLLRRLTRLGAALTAGLFAQGMTTPLLYDPSMGVVVSLAFILALSAPLTSEVEQPLLVKESEPVLDPAKEWNMRPL